MNEYPMPFEARRTQFFQEKTDHTVKEKINEYYYSNFPEIPKKISISLKKGQYFDNHFVASLRKVLSDCGVYGVFPTTNTYFFTHPCLYRFYPHSLFIPMKPHGWYENEVGLIGMNGGWYYGWSEAFYGSFQNHFHALLLSLEDGFFNQDVNKPVTIIPFLIKCVPDWSPNGMSESDSSVLDISGLDQFKGILL